MVVPQWSGYRVTVQAISDLFDISRRDAPIPVVVTYPIESRRSCSTYRLESSLVA